MESEIIPFYSNSNILITGGLGFLGKLIIQKLLRVCGDIDGIYLLIREKKGKSASQRLEEELKDPVFDKLKEERPTYAEKMYLVEGDCSLPGLGLNEIDKELLINKINVIFHCAASMSMDAKIKSAVNTNIKGLNELLNLCYQMRHLKSMVYVSTAYSNCHQYVIEEKFYETPIKADTLVKITDEVTETVLEDITPGLIQKWPNTYAFSKAVAEDMLRRKSENLPVGVFRPTIIMPTLNDPVPGWTSNIYGPVGVMLASGLGVLRVFHGTPDKKFDLVPGDLCVNALICAAWEIHHKRQNENNHTENIPVYNFSGGPSRNITWTDLKIFTRGYEYPLKDIIWVTCLILTDNELWFKFLWLVLHLIPGYFIDSYLYLTGKKPRLIKAYTKIMKFNNVLTFFATNEWNVIHENVNNLRSRLKEGDKKLFPFDLDVINYRDYIQNICLGIKLYIMKETLDNAKAEQKRYQRFLVLHNILKYFSYMLAIFISYKFVSFVFVNVLKLYAN